MHRFHLPSAECEGAVLRLSERDSHHAIDVLRLRSGDRVGVLDGAGREFVCELTETSRRGALGRVIEKRTPPALPAHITLFQAVPKAKAMDVIIQKATELGARRIVPLLAEHCTVQVDPGESAGKQSKWRQTAIEALKQCGAPWLPEVEAPRPLRQCLDSLQPSELSLVGDLRSDSRHPRLLFDNFRRDHDRPPASVALWVGPEGDFTPAELDAIAATGAQAVTLGPQVLRSETAAVYLLAITSYELQAPD